MNDVFFFRDISQEPKGGMGSVLSPHDRHR